jgi:hypothetical protein
MNKDINNLLIIDQEIRDFTRDNYELSEEEFNNLFEKKNYISKAKRILSRLNRKELVEAIKRSEYIWDYLYLGYYLKKYPIDKAYLKQNNDKYLDEYRNLQKYCMHISELTNNYKQFYQYADQIDIDGAEEYLLTNMPNDQIYELSKETNDWIQKLFYFSFFKKS